MMEPFSAVEIDYMMCAVIRQQTELGSRTHIMRRFARPEHLASHEARIELGEVLLQKLTELERNQ